MKMKWIRNKSGELQLHLKLSDATPWLHYSQCPQFVQPDNAMLSPGLATFLHLLRLNWEVVPTDR